MTAPKSGPEIAPVRLVIDNAEPAPAYAEEATARRAAGPSDDGDGDDRRRGGGEPPRECDTWLPPECPVEPLGVTGQLYHYLDERRQYVVIADKDHGRAVLEGLFGRQAGRLDHWFPRWRGEPDGPKSKIVGWRPEACGRALKVACHRQPLWNPLDAIRGPGAWRGEDGGLILHCGDGVLVGGKWEPPGKFGPRVYPASAALPRPKGDAASSREAAATTLKLLTTWRWRRRETRNAAGEKLGADVDAQLLLGWICSAKLGAALTWRSMCWVTGDAATGKSTLLVDCIGGLFGRGLLKTSDASEAGIRQTLGQSALPVAFDELEAQKDPRRAHAIVTLARQAASGNEIFRGGSDHKSTQFTARSSFLFSSILMPPLLNQDRSRLAILELEELAVKDGVPVAAPDLAPERLALLGQALSQRMVEMWPQLPARLDLWRQALMKVGHGGRGADQLGTLLACADLALNAEPTHSDEVTEICAMLRAEDMAERDDAAPDHARCLAHLLTSELQVYRSGALSTVAEWLKDAAATRMTNEGFAPAEAEKALGNHGLRIHRADGKPTADGKPPLPAGDYVAVANSHQGLARLFAGTHWASESGTSGVWMQAMRRLAGAKAGKTRFNGVDARATMLPITTVFPPPAGQGSGTNGK